MVCVYVSALRLCVQGFAFEAKIWKAKIRIAFDFSSLTIPLSSSSTAASEPPPPSLESFQVAPRKAANLARALCLLSPMDVAAIFS